MKRGKYIVVEGPDGSGTTTMSRDICEYLEERYKQATTWTHEPSGLPVGKLIRTILAGEKMPESVMPFLFVADRMMLLETVVKPAMENGSCVVSDRNYWSTLSYQGINFDIEWLVSLHAEMPVMADLLIYLDCSEEVAARRRKTRDIVERYDIRKTQILVNRHYGLFMHPSHSAQRFVQQVVRVSSEQSKEDTLAACKKAVDGLFAEDAVSADAG